ncbi:MAG: NADH-quinone oxidoreductase subunit J [Chromatocurvus sp.]
MTTVLFYLCSAIAIAATLAALTRANAAHGLVWLILSLLAVAVLFFLLGAPFAAALQVLIYAGAIMVLFVFVVMMLNLGAAGVERERAWLNGVSWLAPGLVAGILLVQLLLAMQYGGARLTGAAVPPKAVGLALYGPYVLAVEIASMLLLAALVGAYHIARRFSTRAEGGAS